VKHGCRKVVHKGVGGALGESVLKDDEAAAMLLCREARGGPRLSSSSSSRGCKGSSGCRGDWGRGGAVKVQQRKVQRQQLRNRPQRSR